MHKKSIFILTLLVLTGCAIGPDKPMLYAKPGATDEELQRTIAGCRVQGAMVPDSGAGGAGVELFHTAMMMQTVDNCMRARGFVRMQ